MTTIPVGSFPPGVDFNPDKESMYVTNQNSNKVSVIDGVTNKVAATILVMGSFPPGVDFNPYNGFM